MDIKIRKRKKISELIVDELIDQIRTGKLVVGQQLPNERSLAESMGVSRMPLREAIHALGQAGILETRHGEGTFINAYDSEKLGRTLYWFSLLDKTTLYELVETRKVLEAEAAKFACRNATEIEVEEIRQAMVEREELINSGLSDEQNVKKRFGADRRFHEAIARASHNSIFMNFLMAIHSTLEMQQQAAAHVDSVPEHTSVVHRAVYDAILARDEVQAEQAMKEHLDDVLEAVKGL